MTTKPQKISITQVIKQSAEKIDPKLFSLIEKISKKYKADSTLVKAVCIAEDIERPKWFRNLERLVSFIKKRGTYGIMQVKADKFVSDEESIEIAIREFLKNTEGITLFDQLSVVSSYNSNPNYKQLIEEIIRFIKPVNA